MLKICGKKISSWQLVLLAGDTAAFVLAVALAFLVNPKLTYHWSYLSGHYIEFLVAWLTYLVVIYIADMYDYQQDFRRWPMIARLIIAATMGTVIIIVFYFFPIEGFIGRYQIAIQSGCFTSILIAWRYLFTSLALPQRLKRQLLIIGAGKAGRRLLEAIRRREGCGLEVIGFIDDDPQKIGTEIDGVPVLGNSSSIYQVVDTYRISLLVVAITHEKSQELIQVLTKICWNGCQVLDMPSFYEYLANKVPIEHISDVWLFLNSLMSNKFYYRRLKRVLDLFLAFFTLILTSPLFLIIALLIRLDSRGPVFYLQERLGQEGNPFKIIKFRSMVEDAEALGAKWAEEDDHRITRVGRVLRKLRLDELPQLLNVIRGDMSIVGPRPEREIFIQEFVKPVPVCRQANLATFATALVINEMKEQVPYYSYRLLVKPGITGWAQVMFSYAASTEDTWEKLKYDLYYIKNMGFLLDLAILLKTVRIVLFGRGR
ncbi:MAG: sugar transferase [Deltaproteobacteria bacterium]|nr:sugar transferase [Deltaproteobacteria bacterium]